MSMKRAAAVVVATLLLAPLARAGLFEDIGADLADGAVEKIQPALAATIADVDRRATKLEDHLGEVASGVVAALNKAGDERLDQVDSILEARLLQVHVVADQTVASVDKLVQNSLAGAKNLVGAVAKKVQDTLADADQILGKRIADVGSEVNGALDKADQILGKRIADIDEAVERRLGNVDVIASKQRLGLEETAVHIAVLVGLVVFVIYVLRRLYTRYGDLRQAEAREREETVSSRRLADITVETMPVAERPGGGWRVARCLGASFLGNLVLAGAGAAVVFALYDTLPLAAQKEAQALAETHRVALARSLELLDFPHARFHASQLEILDPAGAVGYRATVAKAELVRDVINRPTLAATPSGVRELQTRLEQAERLVKPAADADLLVVAALLRWQTGTTRSDEHEAARLCARALRMRGGRGRFALAPLARTYIALYLDAPEAGEDVAELRAAVRSAPPVTAGQPLAGTVRLVELMRIGRSRAEAAYIAMADEEGEARTEAAKESVQAWRDLDEALRADPSLGSDPAVLAVFRLDDTLYARAKWYLDHAKAKAVAPLLASVPPEVKLTLAPPRIVWSRRYRGLLGGPASALLGVQEAARFTKREKVAQVFERALAEGKTLDAAKAAAYLGLYATVAGQRVPYARVLEPDSQDPELVRLLATRVRLL